MNPGPRTELSHPSRTGLDDLGFHVGLVSVTIGSANYIPGFEIGRLDISQGDFLVAVGQDAIKMPFHQAGEPGVRLKPTPFELIHPVLKELMSPGLGLIGHASTYELGEQRPQR